MFFYNLNILALRIAFQCYFAPQHFSILNLKISERKRKQGFRTPNFLTPSLLTFNRHFSPFLIKFTPYKNSPDTAITKYRLTTSCQKEMPPKRLIII